MSLLEEYPDVPRGQEWRGWKSTVLIEMRDHHLAWIAERQRLGKAIYPIDEIVRMLERELDKRKVNPKVYDQGCQFGPYEVVADVEDLSA